MKLLLTSFVLALTLFLFTGCRALPTPIVEETDCAQEGETIGALDTPEFCCSGLKAVGGWPGGYEGDCSLPPPPTGLSVCSNCGNRICNIENGENKCNCPQDCQ